MTETSSTKHDTVSFSPEVTAGIVAHGLMSVGMHMAENALPNFISIGMPGTSYPPRECIEIHVMDHALPAWVASIEVDDTETRTRPLHYDDGCGLWSEHYVGRLPNSGVRIDIFQLLPHRHLEAVQS